MLLLTITLQKVGKAGFWLDWICVLIYEYIWFLVITRPFSSFSLHFLDFRVLTIQEMTRKWRVRTSNDDQWREIIYFRKLQSISSPIKKVWIKNLVGLRKTWVFGIFRFFGDFWRKIATQRVSPKISQKMERECSL